MDIYNSNPDVSLINFEAFYNQYWKLLYTTAFNKTDSHADSFDIVQELFIHIWEKRHSIQVRGSMEAYLLTSLRNRIYNHFRNNGIKERVNADYTRYVESLVTGKTELSEQEDLHILSTEVIRKAIGELPEKMRYIFEQNKYHAKTIGELSEELQIAPQTVKNQLNKAQQRISDYLMQHKLLFACFLTYALGIAGGQKYDLNFTGFFIIS